MSLTERLEDAAAMRRGEAPRRPVEPLADAGPDAGLPAPCPTCGGPGFLDLIDVRHHRQREHCFACGTSWVRPI